MSSRARLLAFGPLLGLAVTFVVSTGIAAHATDSPSPAAATSTAPSASASADPVATPTTAAPTPAPTKATSTPTKPVSTATTPVSTPTKATTSSGTKKVTPTASPTTAAPVATSAPSAAAVAAGNGASTSADDAAALSGIGSDAASSVAAGADNITAPTADNTTTDPSATPSDTSTDSASSTSSDPFSQAISDATKKGSNSPLVIALLLGAVSLVPALLVMVTAFTRIVIVLGFTRSALGTQNVPPNQVVIGLALFLTMFVMAPTISTITNTAIKPMMNQKISASVALERGEKPLEKFMLANTRQQDLGLFVKLSKEPQPKNPEDLKFTTIVPAFVISELRTSFLIGFLIFIPFLVIDLVVSAALSSLGMMMLPPALISLPFKLLLFVAADGWYLVVQSLVRSFHT